MIQISRQHLIDNLITYGEDTIASQIMHLSEQKFDEIQKLAFQYACKDTGKKGSRMLLAKACSLAAVDVIEGSPRDLSRKNRIFVKKTI